MILKKLKDYLDRQKVKYVVMTHSPAFTAQEIAAAVHVPGKEMAKTVMVKIDGRMTLCVLPASRQIDFDRLKSVCSAMSIDLANESEFRDLFPGCEVGAMPPFGSLYGLDMVVSRDLARDEEIAFNGGSHREVVKMAYTDYAQVTKPRLLDF